ncbi:hypothetical protein N7510_007314 [Penicillium lagena]|uniref:uncharacterized protein n=1 Tax=Penicillium lagena TaxID=94218 RepID=UPI00253FA997|nr:uncharacterized protein N7510_007314 [Penicillium lagena]KAJ5610595.1 hypothetical protein N7510_007314 [Penicillium lagena]
MHDDHTSSTTELQDVRPRERLTNTPATISAPSTSYPEPHSEDDSLSAQQRTESNHEPKQTKPSVPLQRTVYPVFLVLLYSGAALYAWVVICILTHRPIGGVGYGLDQLNSTLANPHLEFTVPEYLNKFFNKSERYLRAARVVQSLVSVVTIPLTSAVCSQAAVVYVQRKRWRNGPTLRQSMALADKGWTNIDVIIKLLLGGWKKYSSALLFLGLFLHLLGFAISPVQQLFISYKTIKRVQSISTDLGIINQISDLFPSGDDGGGGDGLSTVKLRSSLASAVNDEVQTRLWSRNNDTVSLEDRVENAEAYSMLETKSQNTLANLSIITDPFWAELPSSTTTGLLRQFAPRINSTARWESNTDAMLPADCHPSSDALYLHYMYQWDDVFGYDIQICMPGNVSKSPWKNQNNRQDIYEELYLRMNFSNSESSGLAPVGVNSGIYSRKLTLQTTMGYFELPNYANGGFPGPLIEGDPFTNTTPNLRKRNQDNDTAWNILHATEKFNSYGPKGPLLSIALALFGEGSFVDVQHTNLAAYARSDVSYPGCVALIPFISLLQVPDVSKAPDLFYPCVDGEAVEGGTDAYDLETKNITMQSIVATYFFVFSGDYPWAPPANVMENAFAASAFLANDAMMATANQYPSLDVSYSLGVDMQIPSISREGIIFVSVLLGLDLLCLLAIAIYSAWIPRWTTTLDSFAMLRIGASISAKVPLLATNHAERIKTLDETPGWIGNEAEGKIGQLCLGGQRPLKKTKCYIGYDTDLRAKSSATKEPSRAIRRAGYSLAPGENL